MPEKLSLEVIAQTPDVTAADVLDADALLAELASLSPIDYDQQRESAAKLLGVRMSTLDAAVAAQRSKREEQHGTAQLATATPAPWTDMVDGAQLLADLASLYRRYVVLPDGAPEMLALWTLHTYTLDASLITPRLGILSPEKRCGKTTLLSLLGVTVARSLAAAHITRSALFRVIEERCPTLLIDEADTFLKENEELRGVLNAGHYKPTAFVVCSVPDEDGWVAKDFSVWGPVAIALIGHLPGTLADRAITVRMRRKTKQEKVERLRLDRIGEDTSALRRRCLRWGQDYLPQLTECDPAVPEILNDRAADNWRPLCAIAEVAGGEWPQHVQKAIAALAGTEMDNEAIGALLLEDIRQIFLEEKTEKLASADLVKALHTLEERPWAEWGRQAKPLTVNQLARLLAPFDVKPKTVRIEAHTPRGYEQDDFADAWERYILPPAPALHQTATPQHMSPGAGLGPSTTATPSYPSTATPQHVSPGAGLNSTTPQQPSNDASLADATSPSPASNKDCCGVADHTEKNVADANHCSPASNKDCCGVVDRGAENGEGQQHKGLQAGDWCYLLSADGVQQNVEPYFISSIETGSDGQQYARFYEKDGGWLLARCERTDPPTPAGSPDNTEVFE